VPGEFFSGTALLHRRDIHAIIRLKAGSAYHTERIENMNHIGQRIRELRRKNDLTQEKMADYLGVTYQSVSKWECGTTYPDLAMIVPIARLLHVTADELLGMDAPENDERKAFFDGEYVEFWKKDHEEDLKIARQAVAEYPGDCRYLYWLASNEWYVGYSIKYMGTDTEKELIESCIRHYEMVLENCEDTELRNDTIAGLVYAYAFTNRHDKAKEYAMIYPDRQESSRDQLLIYCLKGKDRELQCKKIIYQDLMKFSTSLGNLRWCSDDPGLEEAAIDAEEAVIKAIITDGNYQHFDITLSLLYKERAQLAALKGNHEQAFHSLSEALKHAKNYDLTDKCKTEHYSCPLLSGYTRDHSTDRKENWTMTDDIREFAANSIFAPLRDRDDFKALFQ